MIVNNYTNRIAKICHDIKGNDIQKRKDAINTMVSFFKNIEFEEGDIIIPAPQHNGDADYTLELATELCSVVSSSLKIVDILKCVPHRMLYLQKKEGKTPKIEMYINGEIPIAENIYFLDNVLATGTTFKEASRLIPNIKPLVYAVTKEGKKTGLLKEYINFVKN